MPEIGGGGNTAAYLRIKNNEIFALDKDLVESAVSGDQLAPAEIFEVMDPAYLQSSIFADQDVTGKLFGHTAE